MSERDSLEQQLADEINRADRLEAELKSKAETLELVLHDRDTLRKRVDDMVASRRNAIFRRAQVEGVVSEQDWTKIDLLTQVVNERDALRKERDELREKLGESPAPEAETDEDRFNKQINPRSILDRPPTEQQTKSILESGEIRAPGIATLAAGTFLAGAALAGLGKVISKAQKKHTEKLEALATEVAEVSK